MPAALAKPYQRVVSDDPILTALAQASGATVSSPATWRASEASPDDRVLIDAAFWRPQPGADATRAWHDGWEAFEAWLAGSPRALDETGLAGAAEFDLKPLLDLVAVGTVADLVPLDANNRALVGAGLRRLRAGQGCAGLQALIERPASEPVPTNWKKTLERNEPPKDPWGRPYLYLNPGTRGEIDVRTSYAIVFEASASSTAPSSAPSCLPITTTSSPQPTSGTSVTSSVVRSIDTRPTMGQQIGRAHV